MDTQSERSYRTKPELALEMIEQMGNQIRYDWVGGDSIYGNSSTLRKGLSRLGRLFVMDVGENQEIFLTDPQPYVPPSSGKGRKKSSWVSDHKSIKVKELVQNLEQQDWTLHTLRQGTKGPLQRACYCTDVYIWSAKRVTSSEVESLRLIISTNPDGSQIKYSLTNDSMVQPDNRIADQELLSRQMQRYWVERGFQDLKDTIGMTDYQVRGWRAWYHHIALTIMALHYMLEQKINAQNEIPLLSCPDIKLFMALTLQRKAEDAEAVWGLIQLRHQQRKADLERHRLK